MDRILYVSDLDGTLLNENQEVSPYTARVINRMVEAGGLFSYATARSFVTASKATAGVTARLPAAVYNGAFVAEFPTGRLLRTNTFSSEEGREVLEALLCSSISPIVYSLLKGRERFSYVMGNVSPGAAEFLQTRQGDIRERPVKTLEELAEGEIFYFTCIDEEEKLRPLYETWQGRCRCIFDRDFYTRRYWLELMPRQATKAHAVLQIKEMLGCEKIIAFGDGKNDIPLFQLADEAYAVENADPALKALAKGILPSHREDGVARWLTAHWPGFR